MTIIDRYILRLFLKVLLVCFVSLSGLFVVVDAFGNLEEFISYGADAEGGVLAVLMDYYAPRIAEFFDRTSPLLALVAAMFALTWLQRSNELTAILAAGIGIRRVVKPLLAGAIVVSLLAAFNREVVIPTQRGKLVRNAQDWHGESQRPVRPQFDYRTDILISGRHTVAAERKIVEPSFRLFTGWGTYGRLLSAKQAVFHPVSSERPAGYLLSEMIAPSDPSAHRSVYHAGEPIILSGADTPWLQPDQLFVASGVDFQQLANGPAWRRYSSSTELLAGLRNPSLDFGADVRVAVHARLVQPLLDITLLFLGLPLMLSRENRSIFVAAGKSLLLVAGFFVIILACHGLGRSGLVQPAFAAWCPLLILVPIATALSVRLTKG